MRRKTSIPRSLVLFGLIGFGFFTPGCGDDHSGPTAPLVVPTPTPPAGLSGFWSGTVRYSPSPSLLCGVRESPVTANVRQNGSAVTVTLSSRCWSGVAVQATLNGDDLTGSARLGDYCDPRSASGSHSGGLLELRISGQPGEICHPGGAIELHR